jgi:hypothetical protein
MRPRVFLCAAAPVEKIEIIAHVARTPPTSFALLPVYDGQACRQLPQLRPALFFQPMVRRETAAIILNNIERDVSVTIAVAPKAMKPLTAR